MSGTSMNRPSGGPVVRFAKSKAKKVKRVLTELERFSGKTEEQAIAKAEEGKEFLCKQCRRWWEREYFEYVFQEETKLASRCEYCRQENRKRYRKNFYTPNKGKADN